ncbi:peptidase [Staphylococcus gallinarum]|uniref:Peptidase n=1 Tax=Staphylococcus gallinarum TaxID=1293 RepID=A0A380FNR2_STAGA|nr:peptidase [Staphylococcus gallinarum]
MRKAVLKLAELTKQYQLNIQLHLNSEPTFQQSGLEEAHYILFWINRKDYAWGLMLWKRNTCWQSV